MHATEKAPRSALFPCLNARSAIHGEANSSAKSVPLFCVYSSSVAFGATFPTSGGRLLARDILANEPVGADCIRPPQSNDSPAGESSFMRAPQFMTKSIHAAKLQFTACVNPCVPAPLRPGEELWPRLSEASVQPDPSSGPRLRRSSLPSRSRRCRQRSRAYRRHSRARRNRSRSILCFPTCIFRRRRRMQRSAQG